MRSSCTIKRTYAVIHMKTSSGWCSLLNNMVFTILFHRKNVKNMYIIDWVTSSNSYKALTWNRPVERERLVETRPGIEPTIYRSRRRHSILLHHRAPSIGGFWKLLFHGWYKLILHLVHKFRTTYVWFLLLINLLYHFLRQLSKITCSAMKKSGSIFYIDMWIQNTMMLNKR
jgi:hypothetical protein